MSCTAILLCSLLFCSCAAKTPQLDPDLVYDGPTRSMPADIVELVKRVTKTKWRVISWKEEFSRKDRRVFDAILHADLPKHRVFSRELSAEIALYMFSKGMVLQSQIGAMLIGRRDSLMSSWTDRTPDPEFLIALRVCSVVHPDRGLRIKIEIREGGDMEWVSKFFEAHLPDQPHQTSGSI